MALKVGESTFGAISVIPDLLRFQNKVGVMKKIVFVIAVLVMSCSKDVEPRSVVIPSGVMFSFNQNQKDVLEYKDAVNKLSENERTLLSSYLAFTLRSGKRVPEGLTIGEAVDFQQQFFLQYGGSLGR